LPILFDLKLKKVLPEKRFGFCQICSSRLIFQLSLMCMHCWQLKKVLQQS